MADLQTYKWAHWIDVKDSDELVIYDTSDPTYIREPEPSLPPLENVIEQSSENSAELLTDGNILIHVETDAETWEEIVVIDDVLGVFAEERYESDGINLWVSLFESMSGDNAATMIQNYTEFPSEIFAVLDSFYKNPTEANYEAAAEALGNWQPEEEL